MVVNVDPLSFSGLTRAYARATKRFSAEAIRSALVSSFFVAAFGLGSSTAPVAAMHPDSVSCAHMESDPGAAAAPTSGVVNALFILACFEDDNLITANCDPDPWPPYDDLVNGDVPAWALDMLSPSVPGVEGSLTHYFWMMSGGDDMNTGALELVGAAYPKVVEIGPASLYCNVGCIHLIACQSRRS